MVVALATFSLAAVLIVLLPGPDTLVVVRNLSRGGVRRGLATVVGVNTGLVVWVAVAALGLAAVLRASHVAYDVLRVVGACYLVWLGVRSWRGRGSADAFADAESGSGPLPRRGLLGSGFGAGLATNLLNPKVGVFFVTFLPGFVPHGFPVAPTVVLFGAVFIVLNVAYFLVLLALAGRVTGWMRTPRVRRRFELVTGTVLIGFGIRLAIES
jgi:threonine/homoserine/homoserine lactone efflux protein